MKEVLLHPTYFPNIAHFSAIIQAKTLLFETHDNYQKQTYRNRTYIYGANGKLALNIPITHTHKNRQLYKDVKIANDTKWQLHHWKSLQSAYRTSPFFEYYEDDLAPIFNTQYDFIFDYNLDCIHKVFECLQLDVSYQKTAHFELNPINEVIDLRYLANVRKEKETLFTPYTQVFHTKHGFINNLSILDVLFNEGPNTIEYLKQQIVVS